MGDPGHGLDILRIHLGKCEKLNLHIDEPPYWWGTILSFSKRNKAKSMVLYISIGCCVNVGYTVCVCWNFTHFLEFARVHTWTVSSCLSKFLGADMSSLPQLFCQQARVMWEFDLFVFDIWICLQFYPKIFKKLLRKSKSYRPTNLTLILLLAYKQESWGHGVFFQVFTLNIRYKIGIV